MNYFGVVIGGAGILSVVLASLGLMVVYGLGLIIWLVWLGIAMLHKHPVAMAQKPATEQQPFGLQSATGM